MNTELYSKEELLQLVLNSIPSFVFWKDRDCNYLGCNQNFATSAGLESPDDIIGMNDFDMPWSREESEFFRQVDKAVMASGEAQINFEEPQTIQDGSTRWLRTSKIPLRNPGGEIVGILGAYEDITERKMIEIELIDRNNTLEQVNAQLEAVNQDLEQFAYATSHDLQEPLRTIGGFIGLLNRKYGDKLDEKGKTYLEFIRDGAENMAELISQILSYSKLGKIEEDIEPVDMPELIQDVVSGLSVYIQGKKASLNMDIPACAISCQAERIKMVCNNLIINGLKFNQSAQPGVDIKLERREKDWLFSFADNGIGIDPAHQDYVFKPFKRLESSSSIPGSGIGLSICKRIIHIHGGEIWFTGNASGGTTFYFTLPALD
ncbi:MAG: ATP-binding protein [Bacteroidota bacterium]